MIRGNSVIRFVSICILFIIPAFSIGKQAGQEVWERSTQIQMYLQTLSTQLDTTPPPPALYPEAEYTWGYNNTLYWNGDSIESVAQAEGWLVLFYEISAYSPETGTLWGYVDVGIDSATYLDLPAGIRISYRLRYYALHLNGIYGQSTWSPEVHTIQDPTSPILEHVEVIRLNKSGNIQWVGEKTVSLRVQASDLNSGKVMQIAFYEFSHNQSQTLLYDIIPPTAVVDTIIPYTLYAEEHEKATLTFWAIDVAGQISEQVSISLFWWDSQGVVCFPNPFNPNVGEIAIIQSDVPDVANARILDPFGRLIRSLNKSDLSDFFEWDGRNGQGDFVSRGGYIFVIDGHKDLYCKIAVIK